jgi:hypothetical protein
MVFFSLSIMDIAANTMTIQTNCRDQTFVSSRNVSVLSEMTSKIWADFAKDWHKIGILQ